MSRGLLAGRRLPGGTPYSLLFDHVLTRTDPERAHTAAFRALRVAGPAMSSGRRWAAKTGRVGADVPVLAMGLSFPNVLGLAAGFDKNAVGIDALAALGFGHVEIGTVTGRAQPGNPKPRLFRLPEDRAIVNRMGFNNDGAEVVAARLRERAAHLRRLGRVSGPLCADSAVVGVNIGKTKVVPDDDQGAVLADYGLSARLLAPYADYLVVNVSSPNTPGLRNLQAVERLEPLLAHVRRTADEATQATVGGDGTGGRRVPLLVKIAPDLDDDDVLAVADLALASGLDGVIATNTTISRAHLRSDRGTVDAIGAGGLSGAPLAARSLEVLRLLRGRVGPGLCLVGVGGLTTSADARARLDAGATLLQGYTAFVYEGPFWPIRVLRGLAA